MTARPLSLGECRLLLRSRRVGRVVFTDRALPSALPVNFLVTDAGIVFRTDRNGPVARTLADGRRAVLGFQVDSFDEAARLGWSVLVVGLAHLVPQGPETAAREAGLEAWGSAAADTFIQIPLDRVTGRQLAPAEPTEAQAMAPVARTLPLA